MPSIIIAKEGNPVRLTWICEFLWDCVPRESRCYEEQITRLFALSASETVSHLLVCTQIDQLKNPNCTPLDKGTSRSRRSGELTLWLDLWKSIPAGEMWRAATANSAERLKAWLGKHKHIRSFSLCSAKTGSNQRSRRLWDDNGSCQRGCQYGSFSLWVMPCLRHSSHRPHSYSADKRR